MNRVKPLLSEKGTRFTNINLVDKEDIISEDRDVAETLNNFFENAVKSLGIKENQHILPNTGESTDPVDIAINKFEQHPSILAIKENVSFENMFTFSSVTIEEILSEISSLDSKKPGTFKNIPTKHLKETGGICSDYLLNVWNNEIVKNHCFPDNLKLADITPIFKKDDATLAKNYRPVSVLPCTSKIFERIIQKQLMSYVDQHLSPYLCGYRKGFSAQHALVSLIEKWKASLDKKSFGGAVLMDLSKAFDTINHELLIAKLHAYGLHKESLKVFLNYLSNRWQRTKINTVFSSWSQMIQGVPQGSVLGPILFNIYINDLFFILKETDVCNFADDTTLHVCDENVEQVLIRLEHDSAIAICWFESNYMKLNTNKCHLLFSGTKNEHMWAKVGNNKIWESNTVKLLGVTIDNQLKFNEHVLNICKKASRKLSALSRMSSFLSFDKKRIIFKAFFESQFKYCPLVWMFHGREVNQRINRLHERALRIVYNDYVSTFEHLLEKDDSCTVHHSNLHFLSIELYKVVNDQSTNIFSDIFLRNNRGICLRSQNDFALPQVRTESCGKGALRYLGPLIWNIIPSEIKNLPSLNEFKKQIRKWRPLDCPCRLCKNYIPQVGFI